MRIEWRTTEALDFGVLRARGPDAIAFLQGQLSNDAAGIRERHWQLSGYHTPQGRAIALLRLTRLAPDDVLAVLPLELAAAVVQRLKRFVLRAKVQITDESAQWRTLGYQGSVPELSAGCIAGPYGRSRHLVLTPAAPDADPAAHTGTRADWIACDIEEGLPQVYAATSEAFVAQMLNLDATDGIAWDKGCYTGQEIIARAHYRGQVKRRMQRLRSLQPCTLAPGHMGELADGRSFKVVEAVSLVDGRSEFLAVTTLEPETQAREAADVHTQVLITAESLPLPYALPAGRD